MKKDFRTSLVLSAVVTLSGCASTPTNISEPSIPLSEEHLTASSENTPAPIPQASPLTLAPPAYEEQDLFSVVVTDVPVEKVLFALARDAGRNIDIHPNLKGRVTLNAIDQTLGQILARITRQVNLRFVVEGDLISIEPDTPYLESYNVNYLNVARTSSSEVSIATEVSSTGSSSIDETGGEPNISNTKIENKSVNQFWDSLLDNINAVLRGGDSKLRMGVVEASQDIDRGAGDGTSIIANRESGIVTVRASQKQHNEIKQYLDKIIERSQRQVLIEATVAEVTLDDNYQAGVDWQRLASSSTGFNFTQNLLGGNLSTAPFFNLSYSNSGNISWTSTVKLLDQFGNTKVLSSPKLMVLNNQTALLKVVENKIYFTTEIEREEDDDNDERFTVETQVNSVPVGFVMSVTPQISETGLVTLNARPTISRITGFVEDPGPSIATALAGGTIPTIKNLVPEIQVREIESVLKIASGDIAVIGGLMQDTFGDSNDGVPLMSRVPILGSLFKYQNNSRQKTELVIFIRPVVIEQGEYVSDLREFKKHFHVAEADKDIALESGSGDVSKMPGNLSFVDQ